MILPPIVMHLAAEVTKHGRSIALMMNPSTNPKRGCVPSRRKFNECVCIDQRCTLARLYFSIDTSFYDKINHSEKNYTTFMDPEGIIVFRVSTWMEKPTVAKQSFSLRLILMQTSPLLSLQAVSTCKTW